MALRHISSARTHSDKIPTATSAFGVKLSSCGTFDFVGRRRALEIQDGRQITGSTNDFAGFRDTRSKNSIQGFMTSIRTKHLNLQQSWFLCFYCRRSALCINITNRWPKHGPTRVKKTRIGLIKVVDVPVVGGVCELPAVNYVFITNINLQKNSWWYDWII